MPLVSLGILQTLFAEGKEENNLKGGAPLLVVNRA
jgi:hypothetical protein